MAGITLDDVRKSYGHTQVIHGVSLDVADGEFIVIVGPSGCGKSTLLRMVAGLEWITGGEVSIDGRRVNELEPRERNIAMVFQNYALYPHMSVYRNMAYGLKIAKLPKPEIDRRVQEAARLLQLGELLERRPRELSGGQRQRVAMGRAIVREPAAFLFDEPLSNLDAKLRVAMRLEIKELQRRLGTTALYVTHDQVEAMTLADRLVVMNAGVAEQIGRPIDVYREPATAFVAGFIGSPAMNLLDAEVAGGAVRIGGAALPCGAPDGPVTLGIRPEHLHPDGDGEFGLRVLLVEALGADTIVHGRLGEDGPPLTARLPAVGEVAEGDFLALGVRPGDLHLFDRDTGARLAP